MSRILKLILKCKQNPKNVGFEDAIKLLEMMSFRLVNVRGSHYHYDDGRTLITIVKPHGGQKFVRIADVKRILDLLEGYYDQI